MQICVPLVSPCRSCGGANSYSFSSFARCLHPSSQIDVSSFASLCLYCAANGQILDVLCRGLCQWAQSLFHHIKTQQNLAILETECFCNSWFLLCCYPGDSGSQQRLLIFLPEIWPGVIECDFEVNLGMWSSLKQLLLKVTPRRRSQSTGPFWGQSFVVICSGFLRFLWQSCVLLSCESWMAGNTIFESWNLKRDGVWHVCAPGTFHVAFAHGSTAVLATQCHMDWWAPAAFFQDWKGKSCCPFQTWLGLGLFWRKSCEPTSFASQFRNLV